MPSTSKKQSNFMAAVAHNPAFAKKVGVAQSVGKDFNAADKGKTFKEGGAMKSDMKQDKAMVKKAVGMHDKQMHGGKKTDMDMLKKGGMPMAMKNGKKTPAFAAKKGGMPPGMMGKSGRPDMMGRSMPKRPMADEMPAPMMRKGGMTKMASGGMASSRADGCATKGKTKGKMVAMNRGGKTC